MFRRSNCIVIVLTIAFGICNYAGTDSLRCFRGSCGGSQLPPQAPTGYCLVGTFTLSIAWITPLLDAISVSVMVAASIWSLLPSLVTVAV